ncbi:MAG: S8 family peptidase, partial [Vicinamibacteria bacterium]
MLNSPRLPGSSPARTPWRAAIRAVTLVAVLASLAGLTATAAEAQGRRARLSTDLAARLAAGDRSGVDVFVAGASSRLERIAARHGLRVKKALTGGAVLEVPAGGLDALAADPEVDALVADADVRSHLALTTATTGAEQVWRGLAEGLGRATGRGVGVAVIDSGIAPHLAVGFRVVASVDFTSRRGRGLDQYGHGTHVGGIIAGQAIRVGRTSAAAGMAPGAHLVNLKVLDADGAGKASSVVEAIDWAIQYKDRFAIRVINLSLGAPVTARCADDPLCSAVERAVRAGLVVVASAGNYGQTADGKTVLGSITSPGNSPYAITVGALWTQGTVDRGDDEVAPWSSRGPTLFDGVVKPDLVAPGSRIVSAIGPGATLARQYPDRLVSGRGAHGYFEMSGTSMAAAAVSGAAALLLEAQPALTPLQV